MVAQCTAHAQLKSVYGVSRVTCLLEPGLPISMSKVRGPGVEVWVHNHNDLRPSVGPKQLAAENYHSATEDCKLVVTCKMQNAK